MSILLLEMLSDARVTSYWTRRNASGNARNYFSVQAYSNKCFGPHVEFIRLHLLYLIWVWKQMGFGDPGLWNASQTTDLEHSGKHEHLSNDEIWINVLPLILSISKVQNAEVILSLMTLHRRLHLWSLQVFGNGTNFHVSFCLWFSLLSLATSTIKWVQHQFNTSIKYNPSVWLGACMHPKFVGRAPVSDGSTEKPKFRIFGSTLDQDSYYATTFRTTTFEICEIHMRLHMSACDSLVDKIL